MVNTSTGLVFFCIAAEAKGNPTHSFHNFRPSLYDKIAHCDLHVLDAVTRILCGVLPESLSVSVKTNEVASLSAILLGPTDTQPSG